jgi:hypothetical protein
MSVVYFVGSFGGGSAAAAGEMAASNGTHMRIRQIFMQPFPPE